MERYDGRLHVRVGETDVERAQTLTSALSITTSALVRLLLQLPAKNVAAHRHVVLDLTCANHLYRELNQWGYQQNQAAHALNRIAYYLRREAMDASDVLGLRHTPRSHSRQEPRPCIGLGNRYCCRYSAKGSNDIHASWRPTLGFEYHCQMSSLR